MTLSRLPKEIRDALRRLEPKVRRAFLQAIGDIRKAADPASIARLIKAGDIEAAIRAMRFEASLFGPLDRALEEAYREGGIAVLAALPVIRDPYYGGSIAIGFDGKHPRAIQWGRDVSSRMITEIVADQVTMAREVIRAGLDANRGPISTALDIVGRINKQTGRREGGFIGLTSGQAQWALDAQRQLEAGDYAAYMRRNLRNGSFDKTVAKAMREGKPLTKAQIERMVGAYRNNILRYRGETIARTETITALRAGRHEGFAQLVDSGAVQDRQISRRWRATGDIRTRDTHRHMNDLTLRGMGGVWNVAGSLMHYPGDVSLGAAADQVINCRCYEEYRIEYD